MNTEYQKILDDPRQWAQAIPAPSDVNMRKVQKRIDQICGLSSSGKSVVRLVWGQSPEATDVRMGEKHYRYVYTTVWLNEVDFVEIPVPRFYLEELLPPAHYMEAWRSSRSHVDEFGVLHDVLGEPPADGFYVYAYTIAKHLPNGDCCKRIWAASREVCFGQYRPVGEKDFLMLSKAVHERNAERQLGHPEEPLSPEAFFAARQVHFDKKEEAEKRLKNETKALVEDFVNTHSHSFLTDDRSVQKWGKYHFTRGHSKSGLLLPR